MAEVYLARKRGPMNFEKLVVVKKIHQHLAQQDEFIKMFLREARISALLKHPRIVDMYDLGQVDKTYFIAMEYLAGQTLARIIPVGVRNRNPLDPLDAARIIADAADGLHAAHTLKDMDGKPKPVIHRDVSPGNIMVLYNGGVKLLDFGIAKARGEITSVGGPVLKGKPGYVSPEQIVDDNLDPRSDVFSLGIVLWEALTGRRLFREADDMATLDAIRTREIRKPSSLRSEVTKGLDDIVLRALDRDPDKRFQSARDFRIEIENMLWTANYHREADSIALFMNDLFADDILAGQQLVHKATAAAAEADDEQVMFVDLDAEDEDEVAKPAGKKGRLPLPAPRQTGEVPAIGTATKGPPPATRPKPALRPAARASKAPKKKTGKKAGIAAGAAGALGSVAAAIGSTAAGAAALASGTQAAAAGAASAVGATASSKAKRLPTPKPKGRPGTPPPIKAKSSAKRADPTPPPIPGAERAKPDAQELDGETDLASLKKAAAASKPAATNKAEAKPETKTKAKAKAKAKGKNAAATEFDDEEDTNVREVEPLPAAKTRAAPGKREQDKDKESPLEVKSSLPARKNATPPPPTPTSAKKQGATKAKPAGTGLRQSTPLPLPVPKSESKGKPASAGLRQSTPLPLPVPKSESESKPTPTPKLATATAGKKPGGKRAATPTPTPASAKPVGVNPAGAKAGSPAPTKPAASPVQAPNALNAAAMAPTPTPQLTMAANASLAADDGRKKRMLYIAGGCAALVLVIILILSMGGGGDDESDKKVAGNETSPDKVSATLKGTDTKPDDTKPDDTKPDDTKPDDTKLDDTKPDDTKPDDTKPDDTKPDDTKPDDTKPDDTKPDDTKPDDTKPPRPVTRPKRDRGKAKALFRKGARSFALGDFFGAKKSFKAAIKADPGYAIPYRGLGLLYKKQKRNRAAVNYLRTYLRRARGAADAANIKRVIKGLGG